MLFITKFTNFNIVKLPFFRIHKSYISTIYALSSGSAKCAVSVIRVSGPKTFIALNKMVRFNKPPEPRKAYLRKIFHPISKNLLDKGLVIWFPGPQSFTGEDSCEFQIHGGIAVVTSILEALRLLESFRPAFPGEFTKRAFQNGKLDLVEIEGLADLIHAETEFQQKQALLQSEGSLSKIYNSWRNTLIKAVANVEAYIDFGEDEHIEDNVLINVESELRKLVKEIKEHVNDQRCGELLRNGVRTVIIGRPNAGKSSILNHLVNRPAAIVTPIAGTTRDIIEIHLSIGGYPVIIADTAGLRNNPDNIVEKEGIKRTHNYAKGADLILIVLEADLYEKYINENNEKTFEIYKKKYLEILNFDVNKEKRTIYILNKTDLLNDPKSIYKTFEGVQVLSISCKTQEGFDQLIVLITKKLEAICGNPSTEHPTITHQRYRKHLKECINLIDNYLENINKTENDLVLSASKLRKSLKSLGYITGHVTSEKILDVIFNEFCIGK